LPYILGTNLSGSLSSANSAAQQTIDMTTEANRGDKLCRFLLRRWWKATEIAGQLLVECHARGNLTTGSMFLKKFLTHEEHGGVTGVEMWSFAVSC